MRWNHRPAALPVSGATAALLVLRVFLGSAFVYAGSYKIADPRFLAPGGAGSLHATMLALRGIGPFGDLTASLAGHAAALGWAVASAELAIGVATLLGVAPRRSAAVGAALAVLFWVTVDWSLHPFYANPDPPYAAAWFVLLIGGPTPYSLEGQLVSGGRPGRQCRGADPSRRTLLARMASWSLVVLASLAAAATARWARGNGPTSSRATPTTAPRVAASSVAVGEAVVVGRHTASPVWIVRPDSGRVLGLSGICTHAACPVQFVAQTFELDCPCHGSRFDARNGAVLQGPATRPLPHIPIAEHDGYISVA